MTKNSDLKDRIIAFDLLRATLLFLLIVVHSGMSFMTSEVNPEIWLFKDSSTHLFFDGLVAFIHAFRLPVFFIVSGFLTQQMFQKYSPKKVLVKRFKRLFLPLLFTVLLIVPLVNILLAALAGTPELFSLATMYPPFQNTLFDISTTYVWFIYYLFLFSLIHILAVYSGLKQLFGNIKSNKSLAPVGIVVLLFILLGFLSLWKENVLYGQYGLIPDIGSLAGYFMFYIFGILLTINIQSIAFLKSYTLRFLFLGSVFFTLYLFVSLSFIQQNRSLIDFDYRLMISSSVAAVSYTFGFIGLALKYYTKPIAFVTHISHSSYFLYLIHFPVLLLILNLAATQNWNVFFKFFTVLFVTSIISLLINSIWKSLWKYEPPI